MVQTDNEPVDSWDSTYEWAKNDDNRTAKKRKSYNIVTIVIIILIVLVIAYVIYSLFSGNKKSDVGEIIIDNMNDPEGRLPIKDKTVESSPLTSIASRRPYSSSNNPLSSSLKSTNSPLSSSQRSAVVDPSYSAVSSPYRPMRSNSGASSYNSPISRRSINQSYSRKSTQPRYGTFTPKGRGIISPNGPIYPAIGPTGRHEGWLLDSN